MTTNDTRTPEEIAYDSLRDGSAYVRKPEAAKDVWEEIIDIIADPTNDGRAHDDDEDTPLSDDERRALEILFPSVADVKPVMPVNPTNDGRTIRLADGSEIPLVRSRDEAHRQERWLAILHKVADMDEPEKSEAIGYMEGLLDGMVIKRTKDQAWEDGYNEGYKTGREEADYA